MRSKCQEEAQIVQEDKKFQGCTTPLPLTSRANGPPFRRNTYALNVIVILL